MASALVLVAEGFEEIEVTTIVDVLRRGGVEVTMAGLGSEIIKGAHGIAIQTETTVDSIRGTDFEMLILPGGQPGTDNLMADQNVLNMVEEAFARGRYLSAICAAPLVLAKCGILEGKNATCYPACKEGLQGANYIEDQNVVTDGNITTSRGPNTAMEFSLRLIEILVDDEKAKNIAEELLFPVN